MIEAIKNLAKKEHNELCELANDLTYIEAYNKLDGYNLTSEPITIGENEKLLGINEFFDVKYKHIETSVFRTKGDKCEVWEEFFLNFRMCAAYDGEVELIEQ